MFFNAGLIEYGHHHFFLIICVDISDRKRLESQLIQSEKMAAIGQLAAGIAHEIRNPLGIITNALYDLGEIVDGEQSPRWRRTCASPRRRWARVQAIINNLLEFSRESRAELEVVDINDLLRKTLAADEQEPAEQRRAGGHRVRLRSSTCMANQNALRQIFLNLITNAVQAMPHGGELRLRTAPLLDGRIQLEFSDTGVGIPPENLKDIFNPFFTTKEPGQGTGLGLSVVHSVVRRYKGDIRVESQVDRGTTFTIEFPCPCASEVLLPDAALARELVPHAVEPPHPARRGRGQHGPDVDQDPRAQGLHRRCGRHRRGGAATTWPTTALRSGHHRPQHAGDGRHAAAA